MDAEQHLTTDIFENPDCDTPLCKRNVEVLLDISEENLGEQDVYENPNQTGWDEAVQGWGQCSPFSCLFVARQKSKKLKPELSASHCVLCNDLKELQIGPRHAASEASNEVSEERPGSVSPPLEHVNRSPSSISSDSSSEKESSDITLKDRSRSIRKDRPENKLLSGTEKFTPDKLLSHLPQPDARCLFLKNRNVEKVVLLGRVMVLPPVNVPTNSNTNPKSLNVSKRREDSGGTRQAIISEKPGVDGDQEKSLQIPQGSVLSKQRPTQHQHHVLSDLSISRRHQIPNNTMAETQPSASSLPERILKQEGLIRSHVQHNSGHRSRLSHKEKNLKRAEPELPMLLGTRIQIPVSTQRLL
ncbi:uncharacterized protein C16orf46 homolog [Tachysurus fulvidraco]|uniref:uncharacterized protein C16orf46 homolog n=1 Tax=Tachysurus fulvidraco TaxID=1234273 RepID=UPI000F50DE9B|nr:uncharacterized protein C16orf46 homolog [Tachysurus fulvidraco]